LAAVVSKATKGGVYGSTPGFPCSAVMDEAR
jgi:hypothetical protein